MNLSGQTRIAEGRPWPEGGAEPDDLRTAKRTHGVAAGRFGDLVQ
jgi:hypothetical protein